MNNPQESVDHSQIMITGQLSKRWKSFLVEQEDLPLNLQPLRVLILCGMF